MGLTSQDRGSAGKGLGEWIVQRVSAVYILLFMLVLAIRLELDPLASHADWQLLSSGTLFRAAWLLFIISLLIHAWIGLKSVFLDYVHNWRIRFLLIMMLGLVFSGMVIWALVVVAVP
jgi:succinate dehydrogenase / fumarate reductase membrane anchor subunit